MSAKNSEKKYATSHYTFYPEMDVPNYLAYGFRPVFLLLAPFIILSIVMWSLGFAGIIDVSFLRNPLSWHIYEMLFGIGIAGIIAFFLTGAPELYPGVVPVIGRHLAFIVFLWVLGRVSFWMMQYVHVYAVALINVLPLVWIIVLIFKPVVLDKKRKHTSLALSLLSLVILQILFFLSVAQEIAFDEQRILIASLGAFTILELLALRRINMEAINELLDYENIDETFYSRSFRYNLSIFCVTAYTIIEFFYPLNSILGYLAFASAASILSITNDFILKENNLFKRTFVWYLLSIFILMALGYVFLGFDYLNDNIHALNHFRHFLTTGVFGLVFYLVMIVISTVHTGRHLFTNTYITLGVVSLIIATFIRALIPFYELYATQAYMVSTVLWILPFCIYMKLFFPYLVKKRADGLPG